MSWPSPVLITGDRLVAMVEAAVSGESPGDLLIRNSESEAFPGRRFSHLEKVQA